MLLCLEVLVDGANRNSRDILDLFICIPHISSSSFHQNTKDLYQRTFIYAFHFRQVVWFVEAWSPQWDSWPLRNCKTGLEEYTLVQMNPSVVHALVFTQNNLKTWKGCKSADPSYSVESLWALWKKFRSLVAACLLNLHFGMFTRQR